jgi:hypothetical protein
MSNKGQDHKHTMLAARTDRDPKIQKYRQIPNAFWVNRW